MPCHDYRTCIENTERIKSRQGSFTGYMTFTGYVTSYKVSSVEAYPTRATLKQKHGRRNCVKCFELMHVIVA